jgi:hypothetical protein
VSLEQEIVESLGQEFQRTMDFEIIADIMITMRGYARVDIDYNGPNQRWVDIKQWAVDNCSGEHQEHNGIWLFELPQDATMFKLKWG